MDKKLKIAIVVIAAVLAVGTGVGLVGARGGAQPAEVMVAQNDVLGTIPSVGDLSSYCGQAGQMMGGVQGQVLKVTAERIATLLGITVDELKTQLQSGKTLAEIAKDKGVSQDKLVQTLLAPVSDVLDVMVKYGYLTKDQAAKRLEQAQKKVETLVNSKLGAGLGGPAGAGGGASGRRGMMDGLGRQQSGGTAPQSGSKGMMGGRSMMGSW